MNLIDDLAKLQTMRDAGVLDADEFVLAKAQILGERSTPAQTDDVTRLEAEVTILRKEQELARLDRDWQEQRQRCSIRRRDGILYEPDQLRNDLGYLAAAIIAGVFLIIALCSPTFPWEMKLAILPVGLLIVGVLLMIRNSEAAWLKRYRLAKATYWSRRIDLIGEIERQKHSD